MRKLSLLWFASFVTCIAMYAGNLKGGFDTDSFPTIRFTWHENNPALLDVSSIRLMENDNYINDFAVEVLDVPNQQNDNKYVILWEDMAIYNQYHNFYGFTKQVLSSFFSLESINQNDYFYIAAYNRTRTLDNTLRPLSDSFTNDKQTLLQAVKNYEQSNLTFNEAPNQSDAFPALNEALELLNNQNNKGAKAIFLFTVGRALENSASNSVVSVQQKSKELHIPIYIVQYAAPYGQSKKFQDLAVGSYGLFLSVNSNIMDENVRMGVNAFNEMVRKAESRYQGHDYAFSYQSLTERGGNAATLTLSIAGADTQLQMIPAKHNFKSWIKTHLLLSLLLILLVVAGITVGGIVFVTRAAKHNQEISTLRQEQEMAAHQAAAAQNALESYKQEQQQQEVARQNTELQKQLTSIMRSKNLYPILYISENEHNSTFEISKPTTLIGRRNDNDLVLKNNAVSRNHAQICFNGVDFVLEDLNSTNGIFVNGAIVQKSHTLKDRDMINIGQAIITFKI